DIPADGPDRSRVSRDAVANLGRMRPSPLYTPDKARLITVGNFEDDLPKVASCQWIIEAVIEQLDVKQELWEQVEEHRSPNIVESTNTSGPSINESDMQSAR